MRKDIKMIQQEVAKRNVYNYQSNKRFINSPEFYLHGENDLIPNICHNVQDIFEDINIEESYLTIPFHNHVYHEVLLPTGVVPKYKNYQTLWNEVFTKTKEEFVPYQALHLVVSFSETYSLFKRIYLCKQIADSHFLNQNVAVQIDIHEADELDTLPHAHFLIVPFEFSADGKALSKWVDIGDMENGRNESFYL